jgi:photosystem II stability/assembly factor-like uncharacterized protein
MSNRKVTIKERRQQQMAREKQKRLLRIALVLGILVAAVGAAAFLLPQGAEVTLSHVHGLGFSPDGEQLIVPAHDGLRIYADGEWFKPNVPERDYMGFTPVDEGFYSSGHPGSGETLANPLGLVKSTDMGQTLQQLAFSGESDFHLMGVGYENHAVYVINSAPNSELGSGLYYSLDDGETWQQAAATGLTARPFGLAVHPTEASMVAMATEAGLFLSDDFGDSFASIAPSAGGAESGAITFIVLHPQDAAGLVTAVIFHPNGEMLLFGATELFAYDLPSRELTELPAPSLAEGDTIGYIAVNPAHNDEIALATFGRDIFLSPDGGQTWLQIAEDGKGR